MDSQQLPFELVALEVALKEVVNAAGLQVRLAGFGVAAVALKEVPGAHVCCVEYLSAHCCWLHATAPTLPALLQVKELEGVALPALDALTKSVSTGNLERVRKVNGTVVVVWFGVV